MVNLHTYTDTRTYARILAVAKQAKAQVQGLAGLSHSAVKSSLILRINATAMTFDPS